MQASINGVRMTYAVAGPDNAPWVGGVPRINREPRDKLLGGVVAAAIRALNIPIGTVLAGPLCRTLETAHLIFGRTEPSPDVRGVRSLKEIEKLEFERIIPGHGAAIVPAEKLRGRPYDLSHEEVARRTREAWQRGATEVCQDCCPA